MSHPAINISGQDYPPIGHNFIELGSVDSTNNYAMAKVHAGLASHGMVFFAHEQLAGKGQRGKTWISTPGENIIMSAVLEPLFLKPSQQFLLSACIALGCYSFLLKFTAQHLSIKWPNDLYWRDRKAGGILIESVCKGQDWLFAVVGIGININQTLFPPAAARPVSLKQISGKTFTVVDMAKTLCAELNSGYEELRNGKLDSLLFRYNQVLYSRGRRVKLKKGNELFETTILEVSPEGHLLTSDGSFDFGEIEWVMEKSGA